MPESIPEHEPPLIRSLLTPKPYSHPVRRLQLRETHISWVILTGEDVYKIKKPVDLGFANFSTLELRRHFCEEEIRLNRIYAPDLYLGVVPIVGTPALPRIGGDGPPLEYAVHMRQFDETELLSGLLRSGRLSESDIDELAATLAAVHARSAVAAAESEWGNENQIQGPVDENFAVLSAGLNDPPGRVQLEELRQWSAAAFSQLRSEFARRKATHHVRECHGDLHLGNIVRWQGRVTPFDRIEFNPGFRWIDTANEIAFLAMDLRDRGRADLAHRFINAYLELTGDYACLRVLPFYVVYRALVRAKVDLLRLKQPTLGIGERGTLETELRHYLDLAMAASRPGSPHLAITHGLSGSGKTHGTSRLIESWGAVRIRSDVERKRRFGDRPGSAGIAAGLYGADTTEKTYELLSQLAEEIVTAGTPVIVDAAFLKRSQRDRFRELAARLSVPFRILHFEADRRTLVERIERRRLQGGDPSDATPDVLAWQMASQEPFSAEERPFVVDGPTIA